MVTFQIIFPEIAFSFNMNMGIVHFKLFLKRDMRGIPWVNLEDDATNLSPSYWLSYVVHDVCTVLHHNS